MTTATINKVKIGNDLLHISRQGQGEPLLLLHGLGSSCADWYQQIKAFSKSHEVICVDLRGHGLSAAASPVRSIEQFSDDMAMVLETLQIPKSHIVGMSMGGMVALQFAVTFPQMVDKLIIVNSIGELKLRGLQDEFHYQLRMLLSRWPGMGYLAGIVSKRLFPHQHQNRIRERFAGNMRKTNPRGYRASLKAIRQWSVINKLEKISAPTLIISAEDDFFPEDMKQLLAEEIPSARLQKVMNSGHATPLDQPETFNQIVDQFLKS